MEFFKIFGDYICIKPYSLEISKQTVTTPLDFEKEARQAPKCLPGDTGLTFPVLTLDIIFEIQSTDDISTKYKLVRHLIDQISDYLQLFTNRNTFKSIIMRLQGYIAPKMQRIIVLIISNGLRIKFPGHTFAKKTKLRRLSVAV